MLQQVQIAVVVPAYNEERHIAATLRAIPPYVDSVIVVDDGSHDATEQAARSLGDARVHVVRHARNLGVGAALCTGYECAFAQGADVVAVMAGDNQMHPEDLHALLLPVVAGEADYVKGDRLSHPEVRARMPLQRFVGNHVLSFFTRLATGLSVSDSQCGYTALHSRAFSHLPLQRVWRGYGYPNDLIGWLANAELRVRDVMVRPVYADEQSGVRLHHALFVVPYVLARVALRRMAGLARSSHAPLLSPATRSALPVSVVGLVATDTRMPPRES